MAKKHGAHHHMAKAMEHMKDAHLAMKMAKKATGKVGSAKEEKGMARKGDYRGNSAKRTNKPNESKK
jgi:hypothetical protein